MHRTMISETSCLIVLTNMGEPDSLQNMYGKIIPAIEVATEYGVPLPEWAGIEIFKNHYRQKFLEMQVGKGEASALALALETTDSTVITDDYRAIKVAGEFKISYSGTIGVIIRAKLKGVIPSLKPLLSKMKQAGFRLKNEVEQQALKEAGE